MSIPAMYTRATDGSISGVTFYLDFTPYQADVSHAGFPLLLEELKKAEPDTDRLIALTLPIEAVREAVADAVAADYLPAGVVSVTSTEIRYNGEVVTGVLVDRILSMLSEGFDIMPMVRFLENVYQNPATYARDELYLWLEKSHLPITSDGFFLAYKNVNSEYKSYADTTFDNTPGQIVSMPREQVDPVRAHTCSAGLHFCSQSYLNLYTSRSGNKVVLLKINPADVVSIPNDYNNAKGRAWKYLVLSQVEDPYARATWPSVVDEDGEDFQDDTDDFGDDVIGPDADDLNDVVDSDDEFADDLAAIDSATDEELGFDAETEDEAEAQAAAEVDDMAAAINEINSYGIIKLRREASKAGLKGAWKQSNKASLRAYLISQV